MKATLIDEMNGNTLEAKVEAKQGRIEVSVKGYGEMCATAGTGSPILIEVFDGKLRVVAWSDINEEEPTIIEMEGAREELHKDPRDEEEQQRRDEKNGLYGGKVDVAN